MTQSMRIVMPILLAVCLQALAMEKTNEASIQQETLKEIFFKALDAGDIETVKTCVEFDQALVNAKDYKGVYAWLKVGARSEVLLLHEFFVRRHELDSDCELDQEFQRKTDLEARQLHIFTWLLGVGIDEQMNEKIYTTCFSYIENAMGHENCKALWLVLTTHSGSKTLDEKILAEFDSLVYQCKYEAELNVAFREIEEKQKIEFPELFSIADECRRKIPYEHILIPALNDFLMWKQNNKNTIQHEDIQKYLRVAFMGRPFLQEFETLLGTTYLGDVAQLLDKETMLMAMKTRSRAFEPLFKRMLLFSQSESTAQLNNTFCEAWYEYEPWWHKGARELIQLKSRIGSEYRYELMRDRKKLCDIGLRFN